MAPNAFGADSGSHSSPTTSVGLTERPERPAAPSSVSRLTAWRVSSKKRKAIGVSQKTSELLLAGWSTGTNKAYQSGWNKWIGRCQRRVTDLFHANSYFLV